MANSDLNFARRKTQSYTARRWGVGVLLAAAIILPCAARAEEPPPDLTQLSIEQLMQIKVTSASKKPESLSKAPAAIFVITGDDLRRGGFTSVPDALRMVPGLHVAQQSAHVRIVSARGFSSLLNSKMLVLIDGRLVYAPSFGGVWWDVQDPPLDDIERIEVIRGPGGTLWGANAVNGVINIITKEAAQAQGVQVSTTAAPNEGYGVSGRYGGRVGDHLAYKVHGTGNAWSPTVNAIGANNYDSWNISQGGVRLDGTVSQKDSLSLDGQGYSGLIRDTLTIPVSLTQQVNSNLAVRGVVKGGHGLARWKHAFNDRSNLDVLGYCDWTVRSDAFDGENRNTCDLEFQHNYSITGRQLLTWGGAVMTSRVTGQNTFIETFVPVSRRNTTYSALLQYDIMLLPDKLRLIAGSKLEHNDYTAFEYQPQVRAVWTPKKAHTLWVAVSRAVRTPTRMESDIQYRYYLSPPAPLYDYFEANPNLDSELLHAYELGYRYERGKRLSLDAALYYNQYDRLIGWQFAAPVFNPAPFSHIDYPMLAANMGSGQTHGLELYVKYTPVRRWTVSTGITVLRGTSVANLLAPAAMSDPKYQANLQSKLDLTRYLNLDAAYYYDDAIPPFLPPVNRTDVGVSTKPIHGFTFSVWGRNLQSNHHPEAVPWVLSAGEIPRTVAVKLLWESAGR